MAAKCTQIRQLASLGKESVGQIRAANACDPNQLVPLSPPLFTLISRKATHVSSYDKNPDDHESSGPVPEDIMKLQSDKYWGPHPQTGVFGPATGHAAGGSTTGTGGKQREPVMEQKAWFRPNDVEDSEKPHP